MSFLKIFGFRSRNEEPTGKRVKDNLARLEKMLSNGAYSALQINKALHITEARKYISRLRQHGVNVCDIWRQEGDKRFKLYYIPRF